MTLAAVISPTGISAPDYATILASLQNSFWSIYGSDANLDPDTQDGALLAVYAQANYDTNQATIATYNAFSPLTAQGVGLSSVVKINGIKRKSSSNSQVVVRVDGVVGTIIQGGIVGDDLNLGTQWALPASVTIPVAGFADVTATSIVPGTVTAAAGSLTKILTPTLGWQTVTNAATAVPGLPVESDATLRQRQSRSTALPAETPLEAIFAAVANVPDVGRVAVYENDTDATDNQGIPSHSIAAVVEGGDANDVAEAIASKKAPGTGTYGTTSVLVFDSRGVPSTIRFFSLSDVPVSVSITIKALTGYLSTTGDTIKSAIAEFISQLPIGENSYLGRLYGPGNLNGEAAVTASGMTQVQLDALSQTFTILVISQSRPGNPVNTVVDDGPYAAGATQMTLVDVTEIFPGSTISVRLDNASLYTLFPTVVDTVTGLVTFTPAIPGGRSVLDGADVFLISDVDILFNEAASGDVANIALSVV